MRIFFEFVEREKRGKEFLVSVTSGKLPAALTALATNKTAGSGVVISATTATILARGLSHR